MRVMILQDVSDEQWSRISTFSLLILNIFSFVIPTNFVQFFLSFQAEFFTMFPARYVVITARVNITASTLATVALDFSSDP